MNRNRILIDQYLSPCGTLILGSFDGRLCLCDWPDEKRHLRVLQRLSRHLQADIICEASEMTTLAMRELDEYFAGKRKTFDMPLLPAGTAFQLRIWDELLKIPYGSTLSYRDLALRSGNATAVRAVANAVGANAMSIVIPCHRIVGGDGALCGYAGGTEAKRALLGLETPSLYDSCFLSQETRL